MDQNEIMRNDDSFGNHEAGVHFEPEEQTSVYSIYVVEDDQIESLQSFVKQKLSNVHHSRVKKKETGGQKMSKIKQFINKYIQKTPFDLRIFMQKGTEENLHLRFQMHNMIAESTFSHIYKCEDVQTKQILAAKIIKQKKLYFDQSIYEAYIL